MGGIIAEERLVSDAVLRQMYPENLPLCLAPQTLTAQVMNKTQIQQWQPGYQSNTDEGSTCALANHERLPRAGEAHLAEGGRREIADAKTVWCVQGPMVGPRSVSQGADADAGPFDEKGPKLGEDMRPHRVERVLEGATLGPEHEKRPVSSNSLGLWTVVGISLWLECRVGT